MGSNGVPNIPEALPAEQMAYEHYQGVLNDKVITLANILQAGGYHTYMTGKWHLGHTPELLPSARGFDRTIAMADIGGCASATSATMKRLSNYL